MTLKKTSKRKTITKSAPAILSLLLLLNLHSYAQPNHDKPVLQGFVDSLAYPLMKENNIPGMSIAITVDGKHYFFNYGIRSKETHKPVTIESLFELGSVSKTFTSTLACLSQLNGNLNLSDPVSKYIPSLKGTAFDAVQLYFLGTHTAGGLPLQLPANVTNTNQLMAFLKKWTPAYTPGTYRQYSNVGIGLLGMIVGESTHEPFEQAMIGTVFAKLGMTNTYYKVPAGKMDDYALGYDKTGKPTRLKPGVLVNEAYGIKSCTKDMILFIDANMNIGIPQDKLARALTATHTGYFKTPVMTQGLIWDMYPYPVTLNQLQQGNSNGMIYNPNPVSKITPVQNPQTNVWINKTGSTNGFSSYVAYIPSKKIGAVMLTNKNFPIAPRVEIIYKILTRVEREMSGKK